MANLAGSTAIISGGLGEIAQAIALAMARAGANVALGDIRAPQDAEPILAQLRASGVRARYDHVDIAEPAAVERWVRDAEADLGVPDLVISNAATCTAASVRSITPEAWNRELDINLNGALYLSQYAARRLVTANRPGRIVFISSWAAEKAHPDIPAYCVSKAALRMLCKCLALNLAADGILVNELALGFVNAGLSGRAFRLYPEVQARSTAWVPIQHLIEPEEVAAEVLHLCDPAVHHMTGSVVLMDGGLSMTNISHASRGYGKD